MASSGLLSLPVELVQYVAVYAHTARDALALAHSSKTLYGIIATPLVFRTRLIDAGWNPLVWDEEARGLTHAEALPFWIRANASCSIVASLLMEARDARYFERPDTLYRIYYPSLTFTQWGSVLCDCGEDDMRNLNNTTVLEGDPVRVIDGEKVWAWMVGLVQGFSQVLTHDHFRAHMDRIISLGNDGEVWRVILRTLLGLMDNRVLTHRPVLLPPDFYPDLSPDLGAVLHNAFRFECFTSTFAHFVLSCDLADLEHIFGALREEVWPAYTRNRRNATARQTQDRFFGIPIATDHAGDYSYAVAKTRRFSSAYLSFMVFILELRLSPTPRDTLSAPQPPSAHDVRLWSDLLPRHSLQGTPLAHLPNDGAKRSWGGYYAHDIGRRDPPMILDLAIATAGEDTVQLLGEGLDNVGRFTLTLHVSRRTGLFEGVKLYTQSQTRWQWRGCVTPFGLIGRWGNANGRGPMWIWPREWSE